MTVISGIVLVGVVIVFLFIGWYINSFFGKKSYKSLKHKADLLLENTKLESENLKKEKLLEANEEYYILKQTYLLFSVSQF